MVALPCFACAAHAPPFGISPLAPPLGHTGGELRGGENSGFTCTKVLRTTTTTTTAAAAIALVWSVQDDGVGDDIPQPFSLAGERGMGSFAILNVRAPGPG